MNFKNLQSIAEKIKSDLHSHGIHSFPDLKLLTMLTVKKEIKKNWFGVCFDIRLHSLGPTGLSGAFIMTPPSGLLDLWRHLRPQPAALGLALSSQVLFSQSHPLSYGGLKSDLTPSTYSHLIHEFNKSISLMMPNCEVIYTCVF